ncbi:FAD-dependent oxidoreductase [Brevibacterium samyangense]|uniref:N-methyl-L-tryptophan oxidase n=1 Tax=Brevibacterium samyangense TaxID=366888 RepID=A0ABP5ESG9_9MICO
MTEHFETIVVGGGLMGSATAWQLAKRGREVMLLERFDQTHKKGASHGSTRNFNVGYTERHYLDLVKEAGKLWRELEAESGASLLDLVGMANHGRGVPEDHVDILRANGFRAEWVSLEEAAERWTGFAWDTRVLYTPDGGRVNPFAGILAFQDVAAELGATIKHGTQVLSVAERSDGTVEVVTEGTTYTCDTVVVTVGAWTNKLVGAKFAYPRLYVTQEQPAHFEIVDRTAEWPSFNHRPVLTDPEFAWFYSPVYGMLTPGEGIKAGWHAVGVQVDPDNRSFEAEPAMMRGLQRYAREFLPGVDPESFETISCTYTMSPDEAFILDRRGSIVLGAGFSGQGAKFTPAIGRVLADFVTDPDARAIPAFAADRPTLPRMGLEA